MIIVLKPGATEEQINHIVEKLKGFGLQIHMSKGEERTIIGAIGDERVLPISRLRYSLALKRLCPYCNHLNL